METAQCYKPCLGWAVPREMTKKRHQGVKIIASFNYIGYSARITVFAGRSENARFNKEMNVSRGDLRKRSLAFLIRRH